MGFVLMFLLVAQGQELGTKMRPNLVLWLDAEEVETTSSRAVLEWRDRSGGGYKFAPLSAAQYRGASARWKVAVGRQRRRGTAPTAVYDVARREDSAVVFPAPLIANNLQLRDGITAFFVLTPTWLQDGDQALGQRFFGHYPFGQFRFRDQKLAFRSDVDHVYSVTDDIKERIPVIAAYRFDGRIAMATNGRPLETSRASHKQHTDLQLFSSAGYVTLGGCPPHNSFVGRIHEIMIFGVPLQADDLRHVVEVLSAKHGVRLPSSPHTEALLPVSHDPSQLRPPVAMDSAPVIPPLSAAIDVISESGPVVVPQPAALPPPPPPPPVENESPRQHSRARDHVPAYQRIKNMAQAPVNDGVDDSQKMTDLLAQLKDAQARLTKLQHDVDQPTTAVRPPVAPVVVAPPPPVAPSSSSSCLGGDAFASVSISKWTPPSQARLEDIQRWTAAKDESDNAIRTFPRGGKELRDFVHTQVTGLRLLRHNLFCALVPPTSV